MNGPGAINSVTTTGPGRSSQSRAPEGDKSSQSKKLGSSNSANVLSNAKPTTDYLFTSAKASPAKSANVNAMMNHDITLDHNQPIQPPKPYPALSLDKARLWSHKNRFFWQLDKQFSSVTPGEKPQLLVGVSESDIEAAKKALSQQMLMEKLKPKQS